MNPIEADSIHAIEVCAEEDIDLPCTEEVIAGFVRSVLKDSAVHAQRWELSITFCSEEKMVELNRDYRGKVGTTDVLTFRWDDNTQDPDPWPEEQHASRVAVSGVDFHYVGDIVIEYTDVKRNARHFDVSEEEELRRVLIHGLLHLAGMDHSTNDTTEPMLQVQEEILLRLDKQRLF